MHHMPAEQARREQNGLAIDLVECFAASIAHDRRHREAGPVARIEERHEQSARGGWLLEDREYEVLALAGRRVGAANPHEKVAVLRAASRRPMGFDRADVVSAQQFGERFL